MYIYIFTYMYCFFHSTVFYYRNDIYMYIYLIHVHIYTSLMPCVTRQNGTDMELSVLVLKGTDMGQKMVSLVTICRNTLVVRCRMPAGSGQMLRDKQNQWNLILKSFEMYIWKYVVWDACLSKPWLGGQKAQGCFNWGYNSESMFCDACCRQSI